MDEGRVGVLETTILSYGDSVVPYESLWSKRLFRVVVRTGRRMSGLSSNTTVPGGDRIRL